MNFISRGIDRHTGLNDHSPASLIITDRNLEAIHHARAVTV